MKLGTDTFIQVLATAARAVVAAQNPLAALENFGVLAVTSHLGTHSEAQAKSGEHCDCEKPAGSFINAWASSDVGGCHVSELMLRQHQSSGAGLSLAEVGLTYGGGSLSSVQRGRVTLTKVQDTAFACLDDRVEEPVLGTPGGDVGEFTLALAAYLETRAGMASQQPSQEMVDSLLLNYIQSLPSTRRLVLCTDRNAVARLEKTLPADNLNLRAPSDSAVESGLLEKLTEAEFQGDSHFRVLLQQPQRYQLHSQLTPMVLKAFYNNLWRQHKDPSSPLYSTSKLELRILSGDPNPQAFLEVSSGELCRSKGVAPMLQPHDGLRAVLVSHLDAVDGRREELAAFFRRVANMTPLKVNQEQLFARLQQLGWEALEATGSRIAAGLPSYTLSYA